MEFLAALGLKWASLIGGFAGALVSLKFIDNLNMWQRATTVLAGTMVSAYVAPGVLFYLELSSKMEGGVAFLCGLFGMSLTGAVIKAIPDLVEAAKVRISR